MAAGWAFDKDAAASHGRRAVITTKPCAAGGRPGVGLADELEDNMSKVDSGKTGNECRRKR